MAVEKETSRSGSDEGVPDDIHPDSVLELHEIRSENSVEQQKEFRSWQRSRKSSAKGNRACQPHITESEAMFDGNHTISTHEVIVWTNLREYGAHGLAEKSRRVHFRQNRRLVWDGGVVSVVARRTVPNPLRKQLVLNATSTSNLSQAWLEDRPDPSWPPMWLALYTVAWFGQTNSLRPDFSLLAPGRGWFWNLCRGALGFLIFR